MPTHADLTGHSIIAGTTAIGQNRSIRAQNPRTSEELNPPYTLLNIDQVAEATKAARAAARSYRELEPETRAAFLETIAANIEKLTEHIVPRTIAESGLPEPRVRGEIARTTGQLRLFAGVVRAGTHHGVRIDPAQPERTPLPRPDIRQRRIALGPVAVFGASNFPLAFSVAGGDTASALAAGCPVIVKAHNAHPGTSEYVGRAITQAVAAHDLDPGVFSLIYGPGSEVGQALVADPAVRAVGFTGSRGAGMALAGVAAARAEPIPVYAEMSAINPVVVFPGALDGDVGDLAEGFVASLTGSSGQLCTAPGVVFVPSGQHGDLFATEVGSRVTAEVGQTMLTSGIAGAWREGCARLSAESEVQPLASGQDGEGPNAPAPTVFTASARDFAANPLMHEEIFGAASLLVRYESEEELRHALDSLEGQLTATVRAAEEDTPAVCRVVPVLEEKVGRILVNGWPTGVEVGHAVIHGGPFPATSDSRSTSVGSAAIDRFLRPVAYQDFPEALLPEPVRDENPWNVAPRLINGVPVV